jgi:hypothetical protein
MASGTGVIEIVFNMIGLFGSLIILLVAGVTVMTGAFEGSGVALVTTGVDVSAGQFKSRCGMIEKARFPAVHGMTRRTGGIELTEHMVRIFDSIVLFAVTALALFGRMAIAGLMTLDAVDLLMHAGQAKSCLIVVKARRGPRRHAVAKRTIMIEFIFVVIRTAGASKIGLVACITLLWRAFEQVVFVAFRAAGLTMRPHQRKMGGLLVIKSGAAPI